MGRSYLIAFVTAFLIGFCALSSGGAFAQNTPLPFSTSQDEETETQDLSQTIAQASERGVSVIIVDGSGRLLSEIEPPSDGAQNASDDPTQPSALMKTQMRALDFRTALFERVASLPAAYNEVLFILRATSPDGTITAFGRVFLLSLLLFGIAILVEKYVFMKLWGRNFLNRIISDKPEGYIEKLPVLALRFGLNLFRILLSMAIAYLLGLAFFEPINDVGLLFTIALINAGYFGIRLTIALSEAILCPFLTPYRLPAFSDPDARKLHYWLSFIAIFTLSAALFGVWVNELGLNQEICILVAASLGFVVMVLHIAMVLTNRLAISSTLLGGDHHARNRAAGRLIAYLWPSIAIAFVIYSWLRFTYRLVLDFEVGIPLIASAYAVILSILLSFAGFSFFIERGFSRWKRVGRNDLDGTEHDETEAQSDGEVEIAQETDLRARKMTTFEDLARRVAAIVAIAVGIQILELIEAPGQTAMQSNSLESLFDVIIILFIGYIAYSAFRIWIDGKIRDEQADMPETELGDEGGGSSASRLATLLPLFRNIILVVIIVTITLISLMEMGINVGPLFAGAGIIGVAIGFGSQSLVRDVFSGAFFLFDDAFRRGEYIDIGGVKGTVEQISIRSFQLRHHLGALHTIPFGEIQVLTNYSRDWVMMKLPLRVTYDTDVEQVRKLVKKLGVQLLDDPVIGDTFIQPLKSQGVIEMQDSAMIIRVKFMTKPGDQWLVRKRVYEEIRALFEKEGIKFAHREVTVRLADGHDAEIDEDKRRKILAAAEAAIDDELMDTNEDGAGSGDDR